MSEGGVSSQKLLRSSPFRSWKNCNFQTQLGLKGSWKNCNFQTQLGSYLLPTFYWKPFIFNQILAIFMSIPPIFLVLMPLLGIINLWSLKKMGGVWGGTSPQKLKKMQFLKSICKIWCIFFANILLKIHYSFPMKYWLLLCLFLPPFHFAFMILALIISTPLTGPKASSHCLTKIY